MNFSLLHLFPDRLSFRVASFVLPALFVGSTWAQEQDLEIDLSGLDIKPTYEINFDESCTIRFDGSPETEYVILASEDLFRWEPIGICQEYAVGQFQYIDLEAGQYDARFYQIHLPPEGEPQPLPPQLEQLRAELGEEAFSQWLQSNKEQTGNLQGIPESELENLQNNHPEAFEQFEETERALEDYLASRNAEEGALPPVALPEQHELLLEEMGEAQFVDMLLTSQQHWGNYQWVCGTALIEMEVLFPEAYQQFLEVDQALQDFLDGAPLLPQPPVAAPQPDELPPSFEDLRARLGDEQFAEYLRSNMQQWGNHQGICGTAIAEMQRNFPELYQQFVDTEQALRQWLAQQS